MRKLFIVPVEGGAYAAELACAQNRVHGAYLSLQLHQVSVELIEREGIDVVISTGLPSEWCYTLRGMNVVSIVFGNLDSQYDMSDIVIDFQSDDYKRYFAGSEYSLCNNPNFDFASLADLIIKLEWDSTFFGFNVAYLSCMHLTETIYRRIERFFHVENIKLVQYLCNCHDARSVRVAEDEGFRFADIRLTLIRSLGDEKLPSLPSGFSFGLASKSHIAILKNLAGGLYEDSRYVFDGNFDKIKIEEFYRGWVEKGVLGQYDDECWCLFYNKKPFAFCTLRYLNDDYASIGLVGLDRSYQGGGFGKLLIRCVLAQLSARNIRTVRVVTQGRNYAAQNLYQALGFRIEVTQLWYHKWI